MRCRTLGHECVYLESRVGKTRGRRKKDVLCPGDGAERGQGRPITENENRAIVAGDISNTGDFPLGGPLLSPANSSGNSDFLNQDIWGISQSLSDEATTLGTIPQLPAMDFLLDFTDGHAEVHEHAISPASMETRVEKQIPQPRRQDPAIDLSGFHSISPTQQSIRTTEHTTTGTATHGFNGANRQNTPSASFDRQTFPMIKFPFRHQRLSNDSKGVVLAAAEILEQLEDKMCAGLSAIDEILRINREVTQRISELINHRDYISSIGSSIVVVAAAHHVVCLFQNACRELYSPSDSGAAIRSISSLCDDSQRSRLSFGDARRRPPGGLPTLGIGFGSFLLDPQEQAALGAQIISTELHRSLRMVQSLSMPLPTTGCFSPDPAGAAVDGWLQVLKQRLRTLISAVEESNGRI